MILPVRPIYMHPRKQKDPCQANCPTVDKKIAEIVSDAISCACYTYYTSLFIHVLEKMVNFTKVKIIRF